MIIHLSRRFHRNDGAQVGIMSCNQGIDFTFVKIIETASTIGDFKIYFVTGLSVDVIDDLHEITRALSLRIANIRTPVIRTDRDDLPWSP
ncbi:hypothetical protein D3C87_1568630 [compost metagenome]